mgnify:CR=1 FL=1
MKNGEGWRDAWNFVDTALRLIENAEYLGDLRVIKEKGITFTWDDALLDYLVKKSYSLTYGARNLRRTIQNLVEDKLAEAVLEGRVREGDSVKLLLKDGQLKFSARHPQTARKQDRVVV